MSGALADTDISTLKGVGPALAQKLNRLGIENLQDILFHLPFRYEDRTRVTPIGAARPGDAGVFEGRIVACDVTYGRRRSLLAFLQDDTGKIGLRFYHFSKAQHHNLKNAGEIRCYGEIRSGASGPEIYHPEYAKLNSAAPMENSLTPIYPATEGISQARYRSLVEQVLPRLDKTELDELVSSDSPFDLRSAVMFLHSPPSDADTRSLMDGNHPAQQRLAFEELVAHQVSLRIVRAEIQKLKSNALKTPAAACKELKANLPFTLTGAQTRVVKEVADDLMKPQPALRLIQGDVGSGKTVVAALAAAQVYESGLQTALMAPTDCSI